MSDEPETCVFCSQDLAAEDQLFEAHEHTVTQAKEILQLEETNKAMESVLSLIGKHFEIDPGDVAGLLEAIGSQSAEGTVKDQIIAEFTELIGESHGVDGLHLNGDTADWNWLMNNQWLEKYMDWATASGGPDAAEKGQSHD